MITQTSAMQTKPYATPGSGCSGCGGGNCGGDCHCGTGSEATCGCNEGLLVQPHFFAGQLLTDEDLQALTNYTVTKHRLHNRFITGSGVSCGLAVTCHPCGDGKVKVQPGYAVDCCGNDILVPCPVELDINTMARDLRFKRLGHDCGDPCKDAPGKEREQRRDGCAKPADRYCLYLLYCEQPSDPVAPYNQEEPCNTSCRPSRLREGFRFELRCPEEEDCPPSFTDRIRCCIGDLEEADFQAGNFERGQLQLQSANAGIQAFNQQQAAQFTDRDADLIVNAHSELAHDAPLFQDRAAGTRSTRTATGETVESGETEAEAKAQLTEKVMRRSLDNVQTLGSAIARWELLESEKKELLASKHPELNKRIEESRGLLTHVAPQIRERAPQFLTSSIELAAADAAVANTVMYIDQQLPMEQRQSFEANLYAYNSVSSPALNTQVNRSLADFKNWLLRKMHRCPPSTECGLMEEVAAVVIPAGDNLGETNVAAADTLVRAFIRYLLDCICSALIPPCPTCEDPAVKLACLEIKDCKVDNICNLERTFLLTEHNLRYWLPFLHGFGEALEKLCCEFSKKFDRPILDNRRDTPSNPQIQSIDRRGYFASGQQISKTLAAQPAYPNILRVTGLSDATVRSTLNVNNSLANLMVRQPQITGLFEQRDQVEAAAEAGTATLARVFEHPQAKAALREAAENQLNTIETRFEYLAAGGLKAAEEIQERIGARVRELENDMSKRLTDSKLASTKVIKDLQASLDEQKKANKALVARLEKLEKGAER